MDLEKLQESAINAVRVNIEEYEEKLRQAAERDKAVASLKEVMQTRAEVFRDMALIAVRNSINKGYNRSMPIPVGMVTVRTPFGVEVDRNLHAVVNNSYNNQLNVLNNPSLNIEEVTPESVTVQFFIEAEEGDVENGLFTTKGDIGMSVYDIGLIESDGEVRMVSGQFLTGEHYEHSKVPVPENMKTSSKADSTMNLIPSDMNDHDTAVKLLAAITDQLPTMRETLDLHQAGVQQLHPVIAL